MLGNFGLEQVEQHVPSGIGEQFLVEEAGAQTTRADDLPRRFQRNIWWFNPRRLRLFDRQVRANRQASKGRGYPADLIGQLPKPRRARLLGDIFCHPIIVLATSRNRQGDRFNAIYRRSINHQFNPAMTNPCRDRIDQLMRCGDDRWESSDTRLGFNQFQQAIEGCTGVLFHFDPAGTCSSLLTEPGNCLIDRHRKGRIANSTVSAARLAAGTEEATIKTGGKPLKSRLAEAG